MSPASADPREQGTLSKPQKQHRSDGAPGYKLRPGRADDLAAITAITDAEFGAGYFLREHQEEVFDTTTGISCVVAVDHDGRVIGYVITLICALEQLTTVLELPAVPGRRFGVMKMSAVRRDQQRRGVGSALGDTALRHLWEAGADAVLASAWIDPRQGVAPYGPTLEKQGFELHSTVSDFWRKKAREWPQYPCSACGGDCRCSAAIYVARNA
jgi:ribosomal protein S18 acetylase RimI-like enzyme